MKWAFGAVGLFCGAGLTVILTQNGTLVLPETGGRTSGAPVFELPTYLTFIGTMLTAVTVVLAAVAIGIGLIAAFTIREIRENAKEAVVEARRIAKDAKDEAAVGRKEALQKVEEALSKEAFDERVAAYITKQRRISVSELEEGFDPEDKGNR